MGTLIYGAFGLILATPLIYLKYLGSTSSNYESNTEKSIY